MGRKRTKPKPRTTYITLDMGRPVTANGLWFDPKTGECALLCDGKKLEPKRVYLDTGYEKKRDIRVSIKPN